jgi:hypothetical protein
MKWLQADVVRGYWRGNKVYDAAVDDQLFFDVQVVHKSRLYKNVKPDRKWPLSGLMQCGTCGRGMSIQKSKNSKPVIRCSSKQRDKSCDRKTTFPYFVVHMYLMSVVMDTALEAYTNNNSNKQLRIDLTKTERELVKFRTKYSNEKAFYDKSAEEGKSTLMILGILDETYQKIESLEADEKNLKELLNNQDIKSVSTDAQALVLTTDKFNLEMHKLGFKIVVGEDILTTIGLDEKVATMLYHGYCRKTKTYNYSVGRDVRSLPATMANDDFLTNKALFDYLNSDPHIMDLWLNKSKWQAKWAKEREEKELKEKKSIDT